MSDSLDERLKHPAWCHSETPFPSPQLAKDETVRDMTEAADEITRLRARDHEAAKLVLELRAALAEAERERDGQERIIAGLNKQLTEQFELSTKYVGLSEQNRTRAERAEAERDKALEKWRIGVLDHAEADLAAARHELNSIKDDRLYQKQEEILLQRDKLLSDLAAARVTLQLIENHELRDHEDYEAIQDIARAFIERTATAADPPASGGDVPP